MASQAPPAIATPPQPPSPEYVEARDALIESVLDDPGALDRFRRGDALPPGYGVALDERVVEYPWALAHAPFGRLLDAGSVLNYPHVLDRFQPRTDDLIITTLAPEGRSYPERHISYVYADLRELPFRSNAFDTVICISTLDHVGMDNRGFGAHAGRDADPRRSVWAALIELRRVLKPGGVALVTVPFGRREDLGWLRQFDGTELDELIAAFQPRAAEVRIYRYDRDGWQLSDREAAAGSRYRDVKRDPEPDDDLAAAARAVACLRLTA